MLNNTMKQVLGCIAMFQQGILPSTLCLTMQFVHKDKWRNRVLGTRLLST